MAHKGGYGEGVDHLQGHMGKHKHAKGHHMGTHGSHEKARGAKKFTGDDKPGLGTGYDAPETYSGSEDSDNTHCC